MSVICMDDQLMTRQFDSLFDLVFDSILDSGSSNSTWIHHFYIRLRLDLDHRLLVFASLTNLGLGPRFADICSDPIQTFLFLVPSLNVSVIRSLVQWGSEYRTFKLQNHSNTGLLIVCNSDHPLFRCPVP